MAVLLFPEVSSSILRLLLRLQPLLWGNALHPFDFQLFRFLSYYFLFITQKRHTFVWRFCCASFSSTHFGGDGGIRTLDLTDANEPTGIVCTWIWPFLAVSANNHFVFKPLVTTIFRVFREPLWYVLWSASEPRWNAPARLVCCLRVDDTSERGVRQQFSAHSNARGAMLNQGIGRVLPCCGSSRKINSGNKIKNLKTGRIIDKLALLC